MKQYGLPTITCQPSEITENKYLAEIPLLKGCRAWGDSPAEALENLQSVATAFIRSYKESKQRLPTAVENTALESVGPQCATEVTVYF